MLFLFIEDNAFQYLTMSVILITVCLYLASSRTRLFLFCKRLGMLPFYFMVLHKITWI